MAEACAHIDFGMLCPKICGPLVHFRSRCLVFSSLLDFVCALALDSVSAEDVIHKNYLLWPNSDGGSVC